MRTGELLQTMLRAFELNADAGADILSIESTGGKEVFDRAILAADMDGIAYALGVLAPQDMFHLWTHIVDIARRHDIVPGGDTACGFGNTAMQLAHQKMLPRVLAAVIRPMTAPRSLVAITAGARGPLKDCGYENPILKALTGVPISMEGKTSACAHSSPLGNIASAMCDLWSNESVQNVRLLSGYAPEVLTEMLIYDARLLNAATEAGQARMLRDLLTRSDRDLDPQALMLDPEVVYGAAERIRSAGADPYDQMREMALYGVEVVSKALAEGRLRLSAGELRYLARIEEAVQGLPRAARQLRDRVAETYGEHYIEEEYAPTIPRFSRDSLTEIA
jgi:methanol--5-hydroxybenzimidazolylcobamide Co-methyltransferase